jgi:hypothetical protein
LLCFPYLHTKHKVYYNPRLCTERNLHAPENQSQSDKLEERHPRRQCLLIDERGRFGGTYSTASRQLYLHQSQLGYAHARSSQWPHHHNRGNTDAWPDRNADANRDTGPDGNAYTHRDTAGHSYTTVRHDDYYVLESGSDHHQ